MENKKCEYQLICPFKHKGNELLNQLEDPTFSYYNKKILKNIKILDNNINELEKIKFSFMCAECNNYLNKEYYFFYPCNHIICTNCYRINVN